MTRYTKTDSEWDMSAPPQQLQWPYNRWWKANIGKRIKYKFVQEGWDRDIVEMATLEILVVEKYDPVPARLSQQDRDVLRRISKAGVEKLVQFLDMVDSLDKAKQFCDKAGITADELKSLLRKLYRYLPFGAQMRQLVEKDDIELQGYVDKLIHLKLGHSLALLETGRTREERKQISKDTGIPESAVLDLVKRADLTRFHLMGGGMLRQSWALGYKGLSDLKKVTPDEYYARCYEHYIRNFKGIPFDMTREGNDIQYQRMKQAPDLIEE